MTLTKKQILPVTAAAVLMVVFAAANSLAFYDDESALQLQVTPRETEVFVDGYFAGTVDNFDGKFQRLHVQPGEHELTLYLDGHHKVTQQVLVRPRASFRIRYTMMPLAAGEAPDPRPVPPARPAERAEPPEPAAPSEREAVRIESAYGAVAIRVQPTGAAVLIDGDRWEGAADNQPLVVQLAPGSHEIQVRKDGYREYTTQVNVHGGETSRINVSLSQGDGR